MRPIAGNRLAARTVPFGTLRLKLGDAGCEISLNQLATGHAMLAMNAGAPQTLRFEDGKQADEHLGIAADVGMLGHDVLESLAQSFILFESAHVFAVLVMLSDASGSGIDRHPRKDKGLERRLFVIALLPGSLKPSGNEPLSVFMQPSVSVQLQ